jgi:iron complex outermembrane recepter protein
MRRLAANVAVAALTAAWAATPTSARAQAQTDVDEVVVTGSLLPPGGFSAPTPITATSGEALRVAAPRNLADALNQLPAFTGSTRSENPITAATFGANGQNLLNLRGLGPSRTLILLDGRRMPASNSMGAVDINILPQGLVRRVDVVTGGASAAYGSDAVAGVVNFVLDTGLRGVKGELRGGVSTHGDVASGGGWIAAGQEGFGGRARIVVSAEFAVQDGIDADQATGRNWFDHPAGQIPNPVAGAQPATLVIPEIRNALGTYGGLIPSGPLKGTQFLPGGVSAPFNPGALVGATFASGGDGAQINIAFTPDQQRETAFARGEFDATPHVTLFADALYAHRRVGSGLFINPHTGAANQFTIFRDNAFLPPDVLARMVAANVASIPLGRYERDFPLVEIVDIGDVARVSGGAKGELRGGWRYDVSLAYGRTDQELRENNLSINRRLYAAADAVRDPSTGRIVCRSTLFGLDPGCVPLNLFGEGSPSADAIRYVTGDSVKYLTLQQTVAAATLKGALPARLSLGAGQIALAGGIEWRRETADQTVDPLSPLTTDVTGIRGAPASQQGRPGSFNFFNPLPLSGAYEVAEAFAEAGLPVLRDRPFARALDLNGAVRLTRYSQTGAVTTWKAGANHSITDALSLRVTRSRDIRGPNILELFNPATQNSNNQVFHGVTTPALIISSGNPDLRPEKADTLTFGAVGHPMAGLQLSLDYYRIAIRDAIGSLTAERTVLECESGNQLLCGQITTTPAGTLIIRTRGLNLNLQETAGYDFEAALAGEWRGGVATLRLLVNHTVEDFIQPPGSARIEQLNQPISPRWRGVLQARYQRGDWGLFGQVRYLDRARFDPTLVDSANTNDNQAPAVAYLDATATWRPPAAGDRAETFVTVTNLFDQKPPVVTANPTTFSTPTSPAYDRIGRYLTAGVRFKF